jgi:phospholipid/cholesterol/gamma-HCH transport system substrate-binding protein
VVEPASVRAIGRDEVRELLVGFGAVVVFCVVLLAAYTGGRAASASSGYILYATFNRIDGLAIGDSVQLAGVPIGKVASMTLGPNFRAQVGLHIDDTTLAIPADSSVAIHTDGLFGRKFVIVEPGGDETALAPGGAISFTQDSLIVSELLDLVISEGRSQRAPARDQAH